MPLAPLEISRRDDAGAPERDSLTDPTPLFLPTPWNAKPRALPGTAIRGPEDDFRYEAPFAFAVNAARLAFPARVDVPTKPADALGLWGGEAPFIGIGEGSPPANPLPSRAALVVVSEVGDGRQVLTQALPDAHPPGNGNWRPMEFLVTVEPAGLVGLPAIVPGSNAIEVATYFQNYLAKVLRIGERLAPGFYRIKVGP
ncbi:MAG TPA: hypothetical protein VG838_07415 [Opitutaceae bacterium]|nr:hypothetical protein [Opitutaceae bacterium]